MFETCFMVHSLLYEARLRLLLVEKKERLTLNLASLP